MALVATVVPCTSDATSPGSIPIPKSSSRASMTAFDGSDGSDDTFATRNSPLSISNAIRSVNVPPVSIPTIHEGMAVAPCLSGGRGVYMNVYGFRAVDDLTSEHFHGHIRLIDRIMMGAQLLQCVSLAADNIDGFLDRRPA